MSDNEIPHSPIGQKVQVKLMSTQTGPFAADYTAAFATSPKSLTMEKLHEARDEIRRVLTAKERFQLTNLVQAKYVEMCISDREFAGWASGQLGFLVSTHQTTSAREVLEIPAALKLKAHNKDDGFEGRIARLESELIKMQLRIDTYFGGGKK